MLAGNASKEDHNLIPKFKIYAHIYSFITTSFPLVISILLDTYVLSIQENKSVTVVVT